MSFTKDDVVYLGSQTREDLLGTACTYLKCMKSLRTELQMLKDMREHPKKPEDRMLVISEQAAQEIAKNFIARPSALSFKRIIEDDCLFINPKDQHTNTFQILDAVLREIMIQDREQPKSPEKAADIAKADRAVEQFLKRPSNSGFTDIMGSCGFNGESQTLSYHILATVLSSILKKRYAHCKGRPSKVTVSNNVNE